MYCPKCGVENPDDVRVCRSCGAAMPQTSVESAKIVPKTSGLAIAAFVLGLLGIVFTPVGIIAVILGIVGIVTIEKSGGRLTGKVFAILGIVFPVVAFCMMLVVLWPALQRVKKQARAVVCMTNLKQWGIIYALYTQDNDGRFFGNRVNSMGCWWMDPLQPYCRNDKQLLICPAAMKPYGGGVQNPFGAWKVGDDSGSYGINGWICDLPQGGDELRGRGPGKNYWRGCNVRGASNVAVLSDNMWRDGWPRQNDRPPPDKDWLMDKVNESEIKANEDEMRRFCVNRHEGFVNGLFMDWSVRKAGLKELWTLKWHRQFDTEGRWTRAGGVQPSDWPPWMRNFRDY